MTYARALVGASILVVVAIACANTTPGEYIPRDEPFADGSGLEASIIDSCRVCVEDPTGPCADVYDVCLATDGCPEFVECLIGRGCFNLPELQDRIDCGGPCFEEFNITSATQPVVIEALPVNACSQNLCADACIIEEE